MSGPTGEEPSRPRRKKVRVRVKLDSPRRVRGEKSRRFRYVLWWVEHKQTVRFWVAVIGIFLLLVLLVVAGFIRQNPPPMPTE